MPSVLFSPITMRGLTLPNRVVVSPMCQYASNDGSATDWHVMHLGHAGRKGSSHPPAAGGKALKPEEGAWETLAPSALPFGEGWHTPRAMTKSDIRQTIDDYVAATRRAERIGYDLIELHGGHGYLLHQFMSPISNQRTDEYGGSLANRMRFPLEVFAAIREVWPEQKPMGIRISATDWIDGGWTPDEAVALARELKKLGCDYIDVSSGQLDLRQKIPFAPHYNTPFSEKIKNEAGIATMSVGMITGAREAEEIVASGKADFICIARGAMWDPRWAWHAAEELGADAPYAPKTMPCHPNMRPQVFPNRAKPA